MTRKLTRITPVVDGYAVVVAQEQSVDGKPGKFLGCFLQTPENPDDGPYTLLTQAMNAYMKFTSRPGSNGGTTIDLTTTKARVPTYL